MGVDEDEDVGYGLGEGEGVFEKSPGMGVCIEDDREEGRCGICIRFHVLADSQVIQIISDEE